MEIDRRLRSRNPKLWWECFEFRGSNSKMVEMWRKLKKKVREPGKKDKLVSRDVQGVTVWGAEMFLETFALQFISHNFQIPHSLLPGYHKSKAQLLKRNKMFQGTNGHESLMLLDNVFSKSHFSSFLIGYFWHILLLRTFLRAFLQGNVSCHWIDDSWYFWV